MRIPILQLKGILLTSIQVDLTDQDALDSRTTSCARSPRPRYRAL